MLLNLLSAQACSQNPIDSVESINLKDLVNTDVLAGYITYSTGGDAGGSKNNSYLPGTYLIKVIFLTSVNSPASIL